MIFVTRLNGEEFLLNHMLIETIKQTPDTVIRLTNEKTLIVKEKGEEIQQRIIQFNRKIFDEKMRTN